MNIIIAILIFSFIIVIHELGHFLLAKRNGIFVTEFSIGMGPRIVTLVETKKGYRPRLLLSQHDFETNHDWKDTTKYSLKLFPIGGSCIMLGEDEAIEDGRAFNKKGVWARISVIFAGPFFNFLLAFILALIIVGTSGYDLIAVSSVEDGSAAQKAGLQNGDIITNINGTKIDIGREFAAYLQFHPFNSDTVSLTYLRKNRENSFEENKVIMKPNLVKSYVISFGDVTENNSVIVTLLNDNTKKAGLEIGDKIRKINNQTISNGKELKQYFIDNPLTNEPVQITYFRNGKNVTANVTPQMKSEYYSLGFTFGFIVQKTGLNILDVMKYSLIEVRYQISITIQSLSELIRGKVSTNDLAGPVGVISMIGNVIEHSETMNDKLLNAITFCILLSANLGVMNLLPLPALDGGRLAFLFLEIIRGKPVDKTKEGLVHAIGLVSLMVLMVFVMFNDINRLL